MPQKQPPARIAPSVWLLAIGAPLGVEGNPAPCRSVLPSMSVAAGDSVPAAAPKGADRLDLGRRAPVAPDRRHAWHDRTVADRPAMSPRLRDLTVLRRVRDRIDREYAQPLDVESLARGANMSAGHLSRQFRLAYGESPYSYLMTRRIERAMALLRTGELSVTEVCFAVGCSSLGTFSTRFTELVGMPPSSYRREAARATAGMPACVANQVTRPIRNREAPGRPV